MNRTWLVRRILKVVLIGVVVWVIFYFSCLNIEEKFGFINPDSYIYARFVASVAAILMGYVYLAVTSKSDKSENK